MRVDQSNEDQLDYWDGASGEYWARRADRFEEGVADYDFVASAGIEPNDRVLDVGCGSGATTRTAAALGAEALGVDLSTPMLTLARARSKDLTNVSYEQADAQTHEFTEFDVVLSRNGVMFFGDQEAAFRNLARALRPGGRLVLMTWQPVADNEWIRTIREALRAPTPERPGFGDPDWIRELLTSTGFQDVRIEPRTADMYLGTDADDALEFITGQFASAFARLPDREQATAELRADFAAHETPRGVRYGSAAWFTRATRP
ncbi:class I SAM-dependent methyltransferase [Actinophytocola algeriensis]|uniref:SAM-dependent methyltransferase n=1 Tax=Actinophytocola algeriensis TaxID=1768010 RepID=A0A7W7VEQ1_9PSEU|nr:class I SAM-dependent methyltransferase [Actinophytocola algeriensis]MBB4907501.1 SAM-dependent methyltransferase [Actinophytocola algeriensis]MBE1479531.1 SAM-dependent methyltransferase [Actinophytocola algeriensis]